MAVGRSPKRFLTRAYAGARPVWSPDGQFDRLQRPGGQGARSQHGDRTHADRCTVNLEPGSRWSPDSRSIYYTREEPTRGFIIRVVPAAGGSPRTVGVRQSRSIARCIGTGFRWRTDGSTSLSSSRRRMCGWRRWNRSDLRSTDSRLATRPLTIQLSSRHRPRRPLPHRARAGPGGMATVYLAQDLRHDRKVAIKVLRPELAAVIGAERFLARSRPPPTCSTRTSCRCSTPARPTASSSTSCRSWRASRSATG